MWRNDDKMSVLVSWVLWCNNTDTEQLSNVAAPNRRWRPLGFSTHCSTVGTFEFLLQRVGIHQMLYLLKINLNSEDGKWLFGYLNSDRWCFHGDILWWWSIVVRALHYDLNFSVHSDASNAIFVENQSTLTHWGRVTHICVSDLTSIGSDNGLSPGRRQAIIRTNAAILLIRPLGTNFSEFLVAILIFSFKKMRLKESSAKRRPFCLDLNELRRCKSRPICYLLSHSWWVSWWYSMMTANTRQSDAYVEIIAPQPLYIIFVNAAENI